MTRYPDRYRGVSVTDVDVPLEEEPLRTLLMSRQVYRRTDYMVLRRDGEHALVAIGRAGDETLFCDVTSVELLAGPEETAYLVRPELDTAIPSQLMRAASEVPDARCVIVEGRHQHVSFALDPTPLRVRVLDIAPPYPAKLVDQVERVLDTAQDLPDLLPVPEVVELTGLLPAERAEHYLFQCRGGGIEVEGATSDYLDEVPAPRDWVMLGCERSRQIHEHFYGALPDHEMTQVDTCPRAMARRMSVPPGEALLTKCCLLEFEVQREGALVVVPFGASYEQLREGLRLLPRAAGREPG